MKHIIRSSALALALSGVLAGAHAQTGKSTEQVRDELAQAIRSGDIVSGESGLTLREQFPQRFPQAPRPAGLTRAQVEADLAAALRAGQVISGGELGARPDQGIPGAFPNELRVGQKTRAQVREELAEAIRTGDVPADAESGQLRRDLNPTRYGSIATTKVRVGADRMENSAH